VFTISIIHFFWESFLIKIHKHIVEALCDLIDAIHLFYQKSVSLFEFWKKIDLAFWFQKIIWCLFKNDIFDILLVEWQVNQATPSLRWLNYKNNCEKKKRINTLTPLLLNHVFLNVWIMVCSELVAHNSRNASLQRINHHIIRGQSLLIIAACAWNEKRLSLLFLSRSKISTSLANPFWAWRIYLFIYFFFHKKIPTKITPYTGGKWNFNDQEGW